MSEVDGLLEEYRKDWVFCVHHALGHMTWSKQRELIRAVQDHKFVACEAAHGLSKTYTSAEIAVVFYNLYINSRVITTAPTHAQVEKLLWGEVRSIYSDSNFYLIGKCYPGRCEVRDPGNPKHFMYGFSTDRAENAEGQHAPEILIIIDEAKGVPKWMWTSLKGAMTNGFCRMLVVSTTDNVEVGSPFYDCFKDGSAWHQVSMSAFDSPYYTDRSLADIYKKRFPDLTFPEPSGEKFLKFDFFDSGDFGKYRKKWVSPKDARIQLSGDDYIRDSAHKVSGFNDYYIKTKVLGRIESIGENTIIQPSWVYEMFSNYENPNYTEDAFTRIGESKEDVSVLANLHPFRAGVDFAWGGRDKTVVFKAEGLRVLDKPLMLSRRELPELDQIHWQCNEIEKYIGIENKEKFEVRVDGDSAGLGFATELTRRGWMVVVVHNGHKATLSGYQLMKDQQWFEIAKYIQYLSCPYDRDMEGLLSQLVSRRERIGHGKDYRSVESKEDYKKRMNGESPDSADSFMLCNCIFNLSTAGIIASGRGIYG